MKANNRLIESFLMKLLKPDVYFGVNLEDCRQHAVIVKVAKEFMDSVLEEEKVELVSKIKEAA